MQEITITNIIIFITCAISLLALYQNHTIIERFKHYPYTEKRNGEWHRLLTSSLVHADLFHLFFNMFTLYSFGAYLESIFRMLGSFSMESETDLGKYIFLGLYLFSILVGNLPSYFREKDNAYYGAIGASGGTSGVVFACILINPWQRLYVMGLPMYGIIFAVLYLVYSSWAAKKQYDNVGHDAHIAGALGGVTFMILSNPNTLQIFLEQLKNPPF